MADISPNTQDIFNQLYSSTMKENAVLDKIGGVRDKDVKQQLVTDKKLQGQSENLSTPKAPEMEKTLPQAPSPPDTQPFDVFKQFAPAMLVLGSAFARNSNTAAITAAATMMNAYSQGNKEAYEQAREKWKDGYDKMLDEHKLDLDQYEADIKESKGNMDVLQAKLTASAAVRGDVTMLHAIQAGNMGMAIDRAEKQRAGYDKLVDARIKMDKSEQANSPNITPETAEIGAYQILKQGMPASQVFSNLGRGKQGSADLALVRNKITEVGTKMGLSPEQIAEKISKAGLNYKELQSEVMAQGRMKQSITASSNILDNSLPALMDIAKKYQLSPSTDLNAVRNFIMQHGSSEDKANFSTQLRAVITDYAMLIGRGKLTVHSDEEALHILNDMIGVTSLEGFTKATKQETQNLKAGMQKTDEDLLGGGNNGGKSDSGWSIKPRE